MTPWPPIISAGKLQRWMVWRDIGATILVWTAFVYLLVDQSFVFWHRVQLELELHGGSFEQWQFRLKPFAILVLVFLLWLLVFGLLSLRHWRRVTRETVPPPLTIEIEARRRGIAIDRLAETRRMKVVTVSIDDAGAFGVAHGSARTR